MFPLPIQKRNLLLKRNAEFLSGYIRQATGYTPPVKGLKDGETAKHAINLGLDADIANKEALCADNNFGSVFKSTGRQRTAYSTVARHYGNQSLPRLRELIFCYRQAVSKTNPALHIAVCILMYADISSRWSS